MLALVTVAYTVTGFAYLELQSIHQHRLLSCRYVLLNLLGKGGFSEVWRAFDLVHAEDVAVKVRCAKGPSVPAHVHALSGRGRVLVARFALVLNTIVAYCLPVVDAKGAKGCWATSARRPRTCMFFSYARNQLYSVVAAISLQVHQLLNNWNEPQKANFIRHVTREYEVSSACPALLWTMRCS